MNDQMIIKGIADRFVYRFVEEKLLNPTGLYVYHAGSCDPSPDYYVERPVPSGLGQGGMFLLEYVESGKGYIECAGKKYTVTENSVYFINRMTTHKYYSDPDDPMKKYWVAFTGPLAHGFVDSLKLTEPVYVIKYNALHHLRGIHTSLQSLTDSNTVKCFTDVASSILRIFIAIASAGEQTVPLTTAERVKAFIDSSESPVLYLDDIAERFGISKAHLIGIFSRAYGVTPHKYITDRKIDAAKQMFEHTDSSIADVSELLCFSSTQYFSRVFKERCGLTPGEYLRTYRRL